MLIFIKFLSLISWKEKSMNEEDLMLLYKLHIKPFLTMKLLDCQASGRYQTKKGFLCRIHKEIKFILIIFNFNTFFSLSGFQQVTCQVSQRFTNQQYVIWNLHYFVSFSYIFHKIVQCKTSILMLYWKATRKV